jgi:hypothetical protein
MSSSEPAVIRKGEQPDHERRTEQLWNTVGEPTREENVGAGGKCRTLDHFERVVRRANAAAEKRGLRGDDHLPRCPARRCRGRR